MTEDTEWRAGQVVFDATVPAGSYSPERVEIARLRAEVAALKIEVGQLRSEFQIMRLGSFAFQHAKTRGLTPTSDGYVTQGCIAGYGPSGVVGPSPTAPNAAEQATRQTMPPRRPTCIDASAALSEEPVPEPWRQAGRDGRRDGLPEFAPKDRQETRCDLLNHPREISARKFPTITAFVTIFRRAHWDIGCLVVISAVPSQRALM